MRLPGPVEVEIYHAKVGPPAEWRARRPGTKIDFHFAGQSTPETLKSQIEAVHFEKQLTEWKAYDTLWNAAPNAPRELSQSDWKVDKDGKVYLCPEYIDRCKAERANSITGKRPENVQEIR